ncbi:MAG: FecR domain-containing protein, partial [Brachymonas sp.]|nr:FecR domain-containing protein [Brachymonas sp.]
VRSAAGQPRAAQRGTVVSNGETIETQNGRAQMRMVDGAFISLQNDTALRLDNYRVANAAEPESALMSLVRGGLRTVTGLIGRSNKSNYRLQTATATVGIRGTGFSATSADDGTRVRVSEGAVALCTQGGCLDLASQQSGFAPNSNTLPIRIATAPVLPPTSAPSVVVIAPQQEQRLVDVSEVVVSQRQPVEPPVPAFPPRIPLTGTATGLGAAYDKLISSPPNIYGMEAGLLGGTLTFDAEGRLLEFVDGTGYYGYRTTAATISDFGSDGIIAWGRWNGGTKTDGINPTTGLSHFNYVTGNSGAAVPIVGTYTVFGSTAPVAINSSTGGVSIVGASNSVTGSMSINFPGTSGGSVSYNLAIPLGGQTFNLTGSAAQYANTNFLGTSSTITSTGGACANACSGTIPYGDAIQGAVFGSGNTRVGAQYGFSSGIGVVTGAVVLKQP